jgi:hypothetical protein
VAPLGQRVGGTARWLSDPVRGSASACSSWHQDIRRGITVTRRSAAIASTRRPRWPKPRCSA